MITNTPLKKVPKRNNSHKQIFQYPDLGGLGPEAAIVTK
jgi:hypothetical protein